MIRAKMQQTTVIHIANAADVTRSITTAN